MAGHGEAWLGKGSYDQGEIVMRTYEVTLTGKTPMLHHADDIDWADRMGEWKNDPSNRKASKAGDDRSPAFRWIGSMYHDGSVVAIPSDNLMRAFMEGGAMVPVPGGKSGKTFKAQTQSGMLVVGSHWPLFVGDAKKTIPVASVQSLLSEKDFAKHRAHVETLGFSLFLKRAKIGASKHVRVRPFFSPWSSTGKISVWDEQITLQVLKDVCSYAGSYKGLGDWRPGGRTPGAYGMFTATVKEA
jgi:hypothetical protein